MPEHVDITDPEIHEPKGASTASAGEVYVSDGAGSGDWGTLQQDTLAAVIADISTSETVYVPVPYAGDVTRVTLVIDGAISAANAVIDVKDSDGNSMGNITVLQSGSAAGDVYSLTPASNEAVTDNDYITVETDGGSTDTVTARVSIVVTRS